MLPEAEYAYKQAIALCPDGPDGNYHLAQLYVESGRMDDAVTVLEEYQSHDRYNLRISEVIRVIRDLKRQLSEEHDLEQQYAAQPGDLPLALLLVDSYVRHQRTDAIDEVVSGLLARPNLPAETYLQLAQRYLALKRLDRATVLLTIMTQRYPQDQGAWYNLCLVQSAQKNCDGAASALERALALDDPDHHLLDTVRRDPRLDNCRQDLMFRQVLGQQSNQPPSSGVLPGGMRITH
jgi:predicted Zn-dependent protease